MELKDIRKAVKWARGQGANRFVVTRDGFEIGWPDTLAITAGLPKERSTIPTGSPGATWSTPLTAATGGVPSEHEMLFASCPEPVTEEEVLAGGEPYAT